MDQRDFPLKISQEGSVIVEDKRTVCEKFGNFNVQPVVRNEVCDFQLSEQSVLCEKSGNFIEDTHSSSGDNVDKYVTEEFFTHKDVNETTNVLCEKSGVFIEDTLSSCGDNVTEEFFTHEDVNETTIEKEIIEHKNTELVPNACHAVNTSQNKSKSLSQQCQNDSNCPDKAATSLQKPVSEISLQKPLMLRRSKRLSKSKNLSTQETALTSAVVTHAYQDALCANKNMEQTNQVATVQLTDSNSLTAYSSIACSVPNASITQASPVLKSLIKSCTTPSCINQSSIPTHIDPNLSSTIMLSDQQSTSVSQDAPNILLLPSDPNNTLLLPTFTNIDGSTVIGQPKVAKIADLQPRCMPLLVGPPTKYAEIDDSTKCPPPPQVKRKKSRGEKRKALAEVRPNKNMCVSSDLSKNIRVGKSEIFFLFLFIF